jgi:opacity protein-like surface antigen
MKKLLLASAVSALFAAPVTALAQAKPPAAPTLDKVLEASGISASGYIDAGYTYADKNVETGFSTRVFDSQNNSFALHQFGLTVAKQPKEGFGGLVNITAGKDAQVLHSFPEFTSTTSGSLFDVTQAFAQYAGGPLTVIAGKFATLHGTEVIASPGNANISRSILFGSVPFTHTGLRATFALGDTVSLIAGLNNGWDQLTDSNKGKTVELGATIAPIKPLTIVVSAYSGKETVPFAATPGNPEGNRTSVNAVVSYAIIDPLSVGVELLQVTQKEFASTSGTISAKYSGLAGYVTYTFIPQLKGTVRLETFTDKDGLRFGLPADPANPTSTATKFMEGTVTVGYLPSDAFELRAEVRRDQADNPAFVDSKGVFSKTLMTMALQGLYKF